MQDHPFRALAAIVGATLFMDWVLGALCAAGILPLFVYFLANIPFGGLYVWMESSWVGTHYVMLGRVVGDLGSLGIWFLTAISQGCLYAWLWLRLRPGRTNPENHPVSFAPPSPTE